MKITKKTNIAKLIQKHPESIEILVQKYGLHCVGCMASAFETLEQGAMVHGMNEKKIGKMVEDLNKKIK